MSHAKEIWDELGATDAYFAVATFDKFRSGAIDEASRHEFFESGRRHIDDIWSPIVERYGIPLHPRRALDYGCGIGRVLLPLAARCESVTGVDISKIMLEATRQNAEDLGLDNIRLMDVDEFETDEATYDFVHSFIVLQHIKPAIGYGVIRRLAERVEAGGAGMVHVTYSDVSPWSRRVRSKIYRDVPAIHRVLNRLRGTAGRHMPMFEYDRQRVYELLDRAGCVDRFTKPTDHAFLGEMIFFRKQS